MARVAPVVPADTDILCERCGYTLNGLPDNGNCPECGDAIAASTTEARRAPPLWERAAHYRFVAFLSTTLHVIIRPTKFFRSLATRADVTPARWFARGHWLLCATLFGLAANIHIAWFIALNASPSVGSVIALIAPMLLIGGIYLVLAWTTKLAAKLTNWEATYRGLRLPMQSVLRGMYYHAAHYSPIAVVTLCTVGGYVYLYDRNILSPPSATKYLYVLCAEVVLGAGYLFHTYWIAMRNLMYANR